MQELIYGNFNNEVVHAIKSVITSKEHKPLYIYGPAGAGKSFLIERMSKKYPGKSQVLKSSDLKKSKTAEYKGFDLLILEDVNTISSRTSPGKKLSELLNHFIKNKKQIVFTANCAPSRLKLSKKVVSEIKKGIVASIKKFDQSSKRKVLLTLGRDLSPEILERLMGDNIKTISQAIKAVEKVRELLHLLKEKKKEEETLKILESPVETPEKNAEINTLLDEVTAGFPGEVGEWEGEKAIRDKYMAQMYIWEMQGFNTNRMKKIIEEPINQVVGEFMVTCEFVSFTSDIERLFGLKKRYELLDIEALLGRSLINEEEIEEIGKALYDPDRVEWVDRRINELEMKQKKREKVYDIGTKEEEKNLSGKAEKPVEMKIESKNLVKIYNKKRVVDDVNLELRRSEIVGLLGPNGAGKSTTFYMITGFIKPESGSIYLKDEDITNKPMHERAKLGIGYLPQEPSIFRGLSVEDNLMSIIEALIKDPEERKERFDELVEEFRLSSLLERDANKLSGGERRRVEIARALTSSPKFLLLDEPFTGIDPITREELQEIVLALRKKDIGILITDHNVRETLQITDRAYLMFDGKIILKGKADDLISNKKAKELYLGSKFKL
jgi:lipopolysaccharide export system ATP-binding protein